MTESAHSSQADVQIPREIIGTLAAATRRHTETLEIDSMSVGPVGSPESTDKHPIVRVIIREAPPESERPVRLGSVDARPIYDDHETEGEPLSEADLDSALRGYTVNLSLINHPFEAAPPYSLDYDALGLEEIDSEGALANVEAMGDIIPFESALQQLHDIVETLRESREA